MPNWPDAKDLPDFYQGIDPEKENKFAEDNEKKINTVKLALAILGNKNKEDLLRKLGLQIQEVNFHGNYTETNNGGNIIKGGTSYMGKKNFYALYDFVEKVYNKKKDCISEVAKLKPQTFPTTVPNYTPHIDESESHYEKPDRKHLMSYYRIAQGFDKIDKNEEHYGFTKGKKQVFLYDEYMDENEFSVNYNPEYGTTSIPVSKTILTKYNDDIIIIQKLLTTQNNDLAKIPKLLEQLQNMDANKDNDGQDASKNFLNLLSGLAVQVPYLKDLTIFKNLLSNNKNNEQNKKNEMLKLFLLLCAATNCFVPKALVNILKFENDKIVTDTKDKLEKLKDSLRKDEKTVEVSKELLKELLKQVKAIIEDEKDSLRKDEKTVEVSKELLKQVKAIIEDEKDDTNRSLTENMEIVQQIGTFYDEHIKKNENTNTNNEPKSDTNHVKTFNNLSPTSSNDSDKNFNIIGTKKTKKEFENLEISENQFPCIIGKKEKKIYDISKAEDVKILGLKKEPNILEIQNAIQFNAEPVKKFNQLSFNKSNVDFNITGNKKEKTFDTLEKSDPSNSLNILGNKKNKMDNMKQLIKTNENEIEIKGETDSLKFDPKKFNNFFDGESENDSLINDSFNENDKSDNDPENYKMSPEIDGSKENSEYDDPKNFDVTNNEIFNKNSLNSGSNDSSKSFDGESRSNDNNESEMNNKIQTLSLANVLIPTKRGPVSKKIEKNELEKQNIIVLGFTDYKLMKNNTVNEYEKIYNEYKDYLKEKESEFKPYQYTNKKKLSDLKKSIAGKVVEIIKGRVEIFRDESKKDKVFFKDKHSIERIPFITIHDILRDFNYYAKKSGFNLNGEFHLIPTESDNSNSLETSALNKSLLNKSSKSFKLTSEEEEMNKTTTEKSLHPSSFGQISIDNLDKTFSYGKSKNIVDLLKKVYKSN